jgi:hypothetical protein
MRTKHRLEYLYPLWLKQKIWTIYLCGGCSKLFSQPLQAFLVRNHVDTSIGFEYDIKSKVRLCHRCLQIAKRKKHFIKKLN